MYCGGTMVFGVVNKNGYAVGCGNADANAGNVSSQGINALDIFLLLCFGKRKELLRDAPHRLAVCLVRIDEVFCRYVQALGKYFKVARDMLLRVATIMIYVERGIVACAHSALSHGGEGGDTVAQVIVLRQHPQSRLRR